MGKLQQVFWFGVALVLTLVIVSSIAILKHIGGL